MSAILADCLQMLLSMRIRQFPQTPFVKRLLAGLNTCMSNEMAKAKNWLTEENSHGKNLLVFAACKRHFGIVKDEWLTEVEQVTEFLVRDYSGAFEAR